MSLVSRDELAQVRAQLVVGVGRNVMKLIDGDQTVVECLDAIGIDRESESGVRADQHLGVAFEERAEGLDLTAVVVAWRIAQVPLWLDVPINPEAVLRQRLVVETGPDGLLGHDDDGLPQALVLQFVERHEHQSATLTRSGAAT